ncbi:MAG: 8-oxo-dGTP diphosphatase [Kiritimatiellia bacterium]
MRTLTDIDWKNWQPKEQATLLFVIQNRQILLIHKKRGLGAGNINGPGGRLEPGETPIEAAVRETQEELCITPKGVDYAGELFFQFTDGHSIHGIVFTATGYEGEPTETDEATPLWTPIDQIPYARMWADDRHWIPLMLTGKKFHGYFIFDNHEMLDHRVDTDELPDGNGTARRFP